MLLSISSIVVLLYTNKHKILERSEDMDALHLSNRLQIIADFVPQNARMADIGSDHAYLPAYLALNGRIELAIAGEVAQGPFQNAAKEINNQKLTKMVIPRLADGLAAIQPDDNIDTITIAGMGGALITEILELGKAKLEGVTTLVLQPNVGEYGLRKWLMDHQFKIVAERILAEDEHTYEIIVAQPSEQPIKYTENELRFGPILLRHKENAFTEKWLNEQQHLEQAIAHMQTANQIPAEKIAEFEHEINLIKEVIM